MVSSKKTKKITKSEDLNRFAIVLKELLINNEAKTIKEGIENYLKEITNKNQFGFLLKNSKPFSNKGVSGAQISLINTKSKSYILKYYTIQNDKSDFVNSAGCIRLYYPYNELVINTILTNMKYFLTSSKFLLFKKKYETHILKIKDFGIYKKKSFILNDKVGFTKNKQNFTSLDDLLEKNIIPLLKSEFGFSDTKSNITKNNIKKNIKKDKLNKQKEFDAILKTLVNKIDDLFKCMLFLNSNIGYIHSDLNCKNIFIKSEVSKKSESSKVKSHRISLITDYKLLVSDLDKATLNINNISILPYPEKISEGFISQTYLGSRFKNIYEVRYQCYRNMRLCNMFESYHFDRFTLLYDIYTKLYIKLYLIFKKQDKTLTLEQYYDKLRILNRFTKKKLNLNSSDFKIFYERINNSLLVKLKKDDIRLSFHINAMIYNFCKRIK